MYINLTYEGRRIGWPSAIDQTSRRQRNIIPFDSLSSGNGLGQCSLCSLFRNAIVKLTNETGVYNIFRVAC
jgi:hypothetical protein